MKVEITVLAEDFKNNSYENGTPTIKGCVLQRAFLRAGLVQEGILYSKVLQNACSDADLKVVRMFDGKQPIEDFTMEVEINENSKYFTEPVIDKL